MQVSTVTPYAAAKVPCLPVATDRTLVSDNPIANLLEHTLPSGIAYSLGVASIAQPPTKNSQVGPP